jgi:hypothetical protein
MAKTTPSKYINAKVVALRALLIGTKPAFGRVVRTADIDLERLSRIPQFPSAAVMDMGGELHSVNGEIWDRVFAVAVIVKSASDAFVDSAHDELSKLTDAVIELMQESRADDGIFAFHDSGQQAIVGEGGIDYVLQIVQFSYKIDREIGEE